MNAKPSSEITATVNWLSGDSDITVSSGSTLTFTPANGDQYQYVTLSAAEDADTSSDSTTIRISATGITSKDITSIEQDNDTALPTVTIAATDANASEQGLDPGTFTVSRTVSTSSALTVNYTIGGSATNGTVYNITSI